MTVKTCARCSVIVRPGTRHCQTHTSRLPSRQARGLGADYDRVRKVVLAEEDAERCPRCGSAIWAGNPLQVDHIVPRCRSGTNERDNLRAICRACNAGRR